MTSKYVDIISGQLKLHGVLVTSDKSLDLGVVFLHGGGNSNSERYLKIQERLSGNGIASLAFDFRGCGKSEGDFNKSTLLDRIEDGDAAINAFRELTGLAENKIFLWGSSMGGHIASQLINSHSNIHGVILQSAAAYGKNAESLPYGTGFTDELLKVESWKDSPAFTSLASYKGKVLVVYGKDDDVIPKEIQSKYTQFTKPKYTHFIDGGVHSMLRPKTEIQEIVCEYLVKVGVDFILEK